MDAAIVTTESWWISGEPFLHAALFNRYTLISPSAISFAFQFTRSSLLAFECNLSIKVFRPDDKSGLSNVHDVRREGLIGANKFTLSRRGGSARCSFASTRERGRRISNWPWIKREIFGKKAATYRWIAR